MHTTTIMQNVGHPHHVGHYAEKKTFSFQSALLMSCHCTVQHAHHTHSNTPQSNSL